MFLINSQILILLCSFFRSPSCLTYGDNLPSSFKIILSLAFIYSILFLASVLVQFLFPLLFLAFSFFRFSSSIFIYLRDCLIFFLLFLSFLLPFNFGHILLYFLLLIFAFSLVFLILIFFLFFYTTYCYLYFLYLSFNLFLSHLYLYAIFSFFF